MAFWLFKCNPKYYRLADRLAENRDTITWNVSRYRREIGPGDIVFLWETGPKGGLRAVMRVDAAPQDMAEPEDERAHWVEGDPTAIRCRVVGTLLHRVQGIDKEQLRTFPELAEFTLFKGNQQGTNFRVGPAEGQFLLQLVEAQAKPNVS